MMWTALLTLVVHLMTLAEGEFTQHFRDFLATKYGREMRNALERLDMGPLYMGSFGGRTYKDQEISNRPVIFVHGVTLRAGAFLDHRKFFMSNGYTSAELYATTYSDGGLSSLFVKKMECKDVKQVGNFVFTLFLTSDSMSSYFL
jgi:hypothetical protein